MRILMIFGLVLAVMVLKAYLVDMIQQYYSNKEKENRRRHILEMKL